MRRFRIWSPDLGLGRSVVVQAPTLDDAVEVAMHEFSGSMCGWDISSSPDGAGGGTAVISEPDTDDLLTRGNTTSVASTTAPADYDEDDFAEYWGEPGSGLGIDAP